MTQKTNKTNNKQNSELAINAQAAVSSHLSQDLKNSLLIVSVVVNLFILTAWIALQVTRQYDAQLASFLFIR